MPFVCNVNSTDAQKGASWGGREMGKVCYDSYKRCNEMEPTESTCEYTCWNEFLKLNVILIVNEDLVDHIAVIFEVKLWNVTIIYRKIKRKLAKVLNISI